MDADPQISDSVGAPPQRPAQAGSRGVRWCGGLMLVGCVGVLGLAAWLRPDARGYGTHEQLGTGPCGWLLVTGYPCPTCGMTTAFAYTVRGWWIKAFLAQPGGFVLALSTFAAALLGGWGLVKGCWPMWLALVLTPFRIFFGLLVVLLGGWGFKLVFGLLTGVLPVR